jgi:formylglycine-generating enzyme required for sulfatase activity
MTATIIQAKWATSYILRNIACRRGLKIIKPSGKRVFQLDTLQEDVRIGTASVQSTSPMKIKQALMRNLPGLIISTFCLMGMPAQVQAAQVPSTAQTPKAGKIFRDCPSCPEMVIIPSGSLAMGSPGSESGRGKDEGPVHQVNIATFALGKTEITRGQFATFVKISKYDTGDKCWTLDGGKFEERSGNWSKPGYPQDDKHPVTCINWNDAQAYAKWLSSKTGKKYRLPTEAEWEYAARGNTGTARYWGANPNDACGYANTADKTAQAQIKGATSWSANKCTDGFAYTAPVGNYKANAYGLYDMLGNVWEWTEDSYHKNYQDAPTDGSAWQGDVAKRVLRGGSWNNGPRNVRAAVRDSNKPVIRFSIFGFRLARSLK